MRRVIIVSIQFIERRGKHLFAKYCRVNNETTLHLNKWEHSVKEIWRRSSRVQISKLKFKRNKKSETYEYFGCGTV